jgi:hypothetical protein
MTVATETEASWLEDLCQHVEARPCVLLRLNEDDSRQLAASRGGFNEFTLARTHDLLSAIRPPTVCLIFNSTPEWLGRRGEKPHAHVGIVSSRSPITTLDTRIKVKRAVHIKPATEQELVSLLGTSAQAGQLRRKLESGDPVVVMSPKLSRGVIEALASIPSNKAPLRTVAESLYAPRRFTNLAAVQEDAVQTALKAFGLGSGDRAERVELVDGRSTALARIPLEEDAFGAQGPDEPTLMVARRTPLLEDSAIEHDARSVPGYTLTSSDLTGRAVFKKGPETLQVITANRRDLEHVFGVDLIYVNLTKRNIVMVQYKMLKANRPEGASTDWLYWPDQGLTDQIAKMKRFAVQNAPGPLEYRLSPQVFYLKFIKRDAAITNGSIITPIDHYEQLLADPACRGERNGVRISYDSLNGRYMRQGAFVDLIKSGYIGAYAATTDHFEALIQSVLDGDRALVAAIQTSRV